jgi:hypothetical protein
MTVPLNTHGKATSEPQHMTPPACFEIPSVLILRNHPNFSAQKKHLFWILKNFELHPTRGIETTTSPIPEIMPAIRAVSISE